MSSSADIRSILDRLATVEEGKLTPVNVKHGFNKQQKSVDQLPALFKPRDISPTLTKKPYQKHPMDGKLVGDSIEPTKSPLEEAMQEVEEDMLSKVKRTFVDYLERLEDSNKIDSHLVRKAKDELDIANDSDPENEEIDEDPTQQDFDVVPAQAPIEDPTLAEVYDEEFDDMQQGIKNATVIGGTGLAMMGLLEAPVKTYPMEDGSMLECYGDEATGFEIRHGERRLPTRFRNVNDADMAVKIFQKRNRKPDGNQDYLEER
jgi:hypothetical protein